MGKKARAKARPGTIAAPSQPARPDRRAPRVTLLILAIAILAALAAMQPVLDNDFTNIDDPRYVTENEILQSGRIRPFLSDIYFGHYNPITMLSYAADFRISGVRPSSYHATNLLIHVLNTILAFVFVRHLTMRLWPAAVAALLFAVHPTQVEPVAWISCRKDLLYTLFYLGGQIAYVRYVRRGGASNGLLIGVYLAFIASAFSKAVAMTFPLVMVLIDFVLARSVTRRSWIEKIPFFATSAVIGYVAIVAQRSVEAVAVQDPYSLFDRLILVSYAPLHYLGKLVWPSHLSMLYPYPRIAGAILLSPLITASLVVLVLATLRWTRWIAFGFGMFIAGLFPVLQILAVGSAIAADRYTYLPFIGLFLLLGMGLERIVLRRPGWQPVVIAGVAAVVVLFIPLSRSRADVWQDSMTLWNDQVAKQPRHALAYNMRGREFIKQGRFDDALKDVEVAIALDPKVINPWINRAGLRASKGDFEGALSDLERAVALDARDFDAQFNRGLVLDGLRRYPEAAEAFRLASNLAPTDVRPIVSRGRALDLAGRRDEGLAELSRALVVDPGAPEPYQVRAQIRQRLADHPAAIEDWSAYLNLRPGDANALLARSQSWRDMGNRDAALKDAQAAAALGMKVDPAYLASLQ